MNPSYIPPSSPGDPIAEELVVLFLEGAARATTAFQELHDQILPKCDWDNNHFPLADVEAWMGHWHLDFDNYELRGRVFEQAVQVLRYWAAHPDAREALAVDAGLWDHLKHPKRRLSSDKSPSVRLSHWNSDRENHPAWAARVRAGVEAYIRAEERRNTAELQKYDARAFEPENLLAFEWLALRVCLKLSATRIKRRYPTVKASAAAINKSIGRLAARLGMRE